jgi:hypothetical protein
MEIMESYNEYSNRKEEDFGIYRNKAILDKLGKECIGLLKKQDINSPISILDLFSGFGTFGLAIFDHLKVFSPTLTFVESNLERVHNSISKICNNSSYGHAVLHKASGCSGMTKKIGPFTWLHENVLNLHFMEEFSVITARFGPKEIPVEIKNVFFRRINSCLKKKGLFVMLDMYVFSEFQEELNQIHWLKHSLGGRNTMGWISTRNQLFNLLNQNGFVLIYEVRDLVSSVSTNDWVKNGQITLQQRRILDSFIRSFAEPFKKAFFIKDSYDGIKLNFPIHAIIAEKGEGRQ